MKNECGEIAVITGARHHQVVLHILHVLSLRIILYSKIDPESFHEHPVPFI